METSHDKANGKPNGNGTYYDEGDVSICPDAVLLKRRVYVFKILNIFKRRRRIKFFMTK